MTAARAFLLAALALLFTAALDLGSGSVFLAPGEIWRALISGPAAGAGEAGELIWQLRLPRVLAAALAGSALSVAGFQMQTLFRNPLAGPYELGLSAGAGLGVALFLMLGTGASLLGQAGLLGAAMLGAGLVMALLAVLAPLLRSAAALLLAGLLLSSGLGACIAALQAFSEAEALQSFIQWTLGSVGGVTWGQLAYLAPICLAGMAAAAAGAKSLTALMLGEEEARSLGARVRAGRMAVAACASILAAAVTAFCGPVAFLGLAMPHVARWVTGRSDPRLLTPFSALAGASALMLCDALAQFAVPGRVLPINVVASALGAPLALFLLLRHQRRAEA